MNPVSFYIPCRVGYYVRTQDVTHISMLQRNIIHPSRLYHAVQSVCTCLYTSVYKNLLLHLCNLIPSHVHMGIHVCVFVYMYMYMHMYMYMYTYIYIYKDVYVYTCVYVYIYICVCVCVFTHYV